MQNLKFKLIKLSWFLVLSLLLSSCATVFSGTTQDVNIKVMDSVEHEPLSGTTCKIIDANGAEYYLASNPGVVKVTRGNGNLSILCKKEGYEQLNISVGDSFNAISVANIIFWPGFIVDGLSGAYKKYPSHYMVMMKKV